MDLYFKRHDGHAVTCDDFLAAMADANGADLSAMANWYSQAGTPHLDISTEYNSGTAWRDGSSHGSTYLQGANPAVHL